MLMVYQGMIQVITCENENIIQTIALDCWHNVSRCSSSM